MSPVTIVVACSTTLFAAAAITPLIDMLSGRTLLAQHSGTRPMSTSTQIITDEQQILDHIHGIFRAYLDKDRDTIRRTHTEDWVGFQVGSREMVRGINAYMLNADATLDNTIPVAYDLLDTDISVYDDVAIVYYLASYTYRDHEDEENTVRLRSVDIYRKDDDGHWNQCGSNICRVPQPSDNPSVDATRPRVLVPREQAELLEARESVWRAWFAGDVDALRELVPEETIAIEPDSGDWADLAEIMRRSRTFIDSGAKLVRLEFPVTQIQAFGPVAILYTTYLFEIESVEGQHTTTAGRGTEIFVKRDGHWVNPGWHLDSRSQVPFDGSKGRLHR